jgi:hypothetical protein
MEPDCHGNHGLLDGKRGGRDHPEKCTSVQQKAREIGGHEDHQLTKRRPRPEAVKRSTIGS